MISLKPDANLTQDEVIAYLSPPLSLLLSFSLFLSPPLSFLLLSPLPSSSPLVFTPPLLLSSSPPFTKLLSLVCITPQIQQEASGRLQMSKNSQICKGVSKNSHRENSEEQSGGDACWWKFVIVNIFHGTQVLPFITPYTSKASPSCIN